MYKLEMINPYLPTECMELLEKLACKFLIWRLQVGYGPECESSDLDDFEDMYKNGKLSENIRHGGRCGGCRAKETIDSLIYLFE